MKGGGGCEGRGRRWREGEGIEGGRGNEGRESIRCIGDLGLQLL